nr:hypothetical protein CFP56_24381 [Quercus suber]
MDECLRRQRSVIVVVDTFHDRQRHQVSSHLLRIELFILHEQQECNDTGLRLPLQGTGDDDTAGKAKIVLHKPAGSDGFMCAAVTGPRVCGLLHRSISPYHTSGQGSSISESVGSKSASMIERNCKVTFIYQYQGSVAEVSVLVCSSMADDPGGQDLLTILALGFLDQHRSADLSRGEHQLREIFNMIRNGSARRAIQMPHMGKVTWH